MSSRASQTATMMAAATTRVVIGPDGRIRQETAPITGAVDAGNVTISVSRLLGLANITMGGTIDGDQLTLSGAQATSVIWKRADVAEYQHRVAELNAESQQAIAAKTAADARALIAQQQSEILAEMGRILGRMQQFDTQADVYLARFPGAKGRYKDLTAKMTQDVARERELSVPFAGGARSRLVADTNQASVITNQLHNEAQTLARTFEANVQPLADQTMHLEQSCRVDLSTRALTQAEVDARMRLVSRFWGPAHYFAQNTMPQQHAWNT